MLPLQAAVPFYTGLPPWEAAAANGVSGKIPVLPGRAGRDIKLYTSRGRTAKLQHAHQRSAVAAEVASPRSGSDA
jgi:hypothetical protein